MIGFLAGVTAAEAYASYHAILVEAAAAAGIAKEIHDNAENLFDKIDEHADAFFDKISDANEFVFDCAFAGIDAVEAIITAPFKLFE